MPGFFITLMLLVLAAALARFVGTTRRIAWLPWVPNVGIALWCACFLYAAVAMVRPPEVPDVSGMLPVDANAAMLAAQTEQLVQVHWSGTLAKGISFVFALGSLVLTAYLYATQPEITDEPSA